MCDYKQIIIVRHGKCYGKDKKIFLGQSNEKLNDEGRYETHLLAKKLKRFDCKMIITSDLDRAVETAEIIEQYMHIPVYKSKLLREENLGSWTGLTEEEVMERFPIEYYKWKNGEYLNGVGEREGLYKVAERVKNFLKKIFENEEIDKMIIVTHLNVAIVMIGLLLKIDAEEWGKIDEIKNSSYTLLTNDFGKWKRLNTLSDAEI